MVLMGVYFHITIGLLTGNAFVLVSLRRCSGWTVSYLLSVPRCNSSFGQRSFSCYCAPKIWNGVPLLVKQSPLLDSFKSNLITDYLTGDFLERLWLDSLDIVRSTNCYEWMNEWTGGKMFVFYTIDWVVYSLDQVNLLRPVSTIRY